MIARQVSETEFEKVSKLETYDDECKAMLIYPKVSVEVKAALILEHKLRLKSKLRLLGNLNFFDELYNQRLMSKLVMCICLNSLCEQANPEEEKIE